MNISSHEFLTNLREFSDHYYELLKGPQAGLNLTRHDRSPDLFFEKQVYDSVYPLIHCESFLATLSRADLVVDIGFGGGFPILPLAFSLPGVKFIGFEARHKKVAAVADIYESLGLKNVKLYHERLESLLFDRKEVVILSKAVSTVDKFTKMINSREKLTVYFYKGPNFWELESNFKAKPPYFWEITRDITFNIDDSMTRILVEVKNKNVPRGTFLKQDRKLKKISEFC
jgi:16S rRNA (guanine527-N7)-methyltransferase